jgi:hypothetical protein
MTYKMLRSRLTRRFGLASSFVFSALLCAGAQTPATQTRPASTLPPTSPTTASQIGNQVTPPTPAVPVNRPHRAEVRYDSGLLSINANNSSLNSILREISRQTGMKITGGVREERVFGHYGPATPDAILATLIDGTGTNMVLRQTASNAPEELILTPRGGGATPPNPSAVGFEEPEDRDEDQHAPPASAPSQTQAAPGPVSPQPANNVNGSPSNTSPTAATLPVTNSVPSDSLPTPSTTAPANGIVDAPNPPAPGTVNPVTTNPPADPAAAGAAKTPEQIYQQLQQLRQQQQQQSAAPPQ